MENRKQTIIDKLFENRFNLDNFKDFTSQILNVKLRNRKESESIYTAFLSYINSYHIIGDYEDSDGNKVMIMTTKIKEDKDPVRARVKQREFVAKLLRDWHKDGALVVFYNENSKNWRMSFVRLSYEFTIKGIEEKITPAKRLSYVVGEDEACKTAKDQFLTLQDLKDSVTLDQLEEIFALEKVTNDFFKEYKNKYLDIKELLVNDKVFMDEAKKHDSEKPESFAEGFAKKLMGQIAFLYFLQKKGWLGVKTIPESLNLYKFKQIYKNASEKGRDILVKIFEREDQDLFVLNYNKLNELDNTTQGEILANVFIRSEFYNEWGTGDKKFIRNLFKQHQTRDVENNKSFFDDYLEVLFYNNLSKDRGDIQYSTDFNCRIPFLNGGLFDPYGDYDWKHTNFNLKDEIFSNNDKTGILDIFDIYNFTINENDSYETEIAVDPEMLGKVFENLLEVSDRKSKGAFYTPREIVRYMTNESIVNYLLTNLEGENISKEDLKYLFEFGEFSKEFDQQYFEQNYLKKGSSLKDENGKSELDMKIPIMKLCEKIDKLLDNVRIADPACGSGAFPLGILNEIVKARNVLTFYINMRKYFKEKKRTSKTYWRLKFLSEDQRNMYKLKYLAIKNSLYGVDIEPSAIDITKLRLWLSILVDSGNDNVRTLPNLDFNFMIGNSLVDEFEGIKLFDESLLNDDVLKKELEKGKLGNQKSLFGDKIIKQDILKDIFSKQAKFFGEKNADRKKKLKEKIEELETSLIRFTLTSSGQLDKLKEIEKGRKERRKPYFLWKLEFAKVFKENDGFDIVIGNPPYVRYEKFKSEKDTYKQRYKCFAPSVDLYILFFELGYELLKPCGNLIYITSNKWLKTKYGKEFRKFVLDNTMIDQLIDLGSNVFETASVDTSIFSMIKKKSKDYEFYISTEIRKFSKISIRNFTQDLFFVLPSKYYTIKNKIENNGILLKNKKYKIRRGILTGCNDAFIINQELVEKFKNNPKNLEIIYPVLKGKNVDKYKINFEQNYILATKNGIDVKNDYPDIYNYLVKRNTDLNGSVEKRYDQGQHWSNLRNCAYYEEFFKEKIIYPEFSSNSSFCWEEGKYFNLDTTWFISGDINKGLLGILNSKLIWFYLKIISVQLGSSALRMKKIYLDNLPIADLNESENNILSDIVDRIIELKKQDKDTKELEDKIDEMVYDLYELTEDEKELIRAF